ncbi:craniofacial development protein 1 isoform X2 [Carex littledalei]|uniref:Craniofacial development protein 1 isoform X2 n=1 Tax=Carex littledalei TaxID=544730 RepID=A0A833W160_9POAL|nr:craniofacial development protein 1 isoform X2 [Carex littledalei]
MASNSASDSGLKGESSNQSEDHETKARVEETWKKMNAGLPTKLPKPVMHKLGSSTKPKTNKSTPDWMAKLGLAPKKLSSENSSVASAKTSDSVQNSVGEDAKRLAAAALAAVKDAAANAQVGKGKIQITEVRDFAGEDIQVKKLVDANSKEAEEEKTKSTGAPPSALDSVLEQIKKKPKLSVLDKTKKDWGEFKEENKGMEDELDKYKKSSNQYLDKVSFLQRADYREFERERDARLASQAKRKAESRDHDF